MHHLALVLIFAAAPTTEGEALDDEVNAVTMMSIGGGFLAVGSVTGASAVVAAVVSAGVSLAIGGGAFPRIDESTLSDPTSPASIMLPAVASLAAIAVLSAAELGIGSALLLWGRSNLRESRSLKNQESHNTRPSPVFDPDRLERRKKKNSMGYDRDEADDEEGRTIVDD